MTHCQPCQLLAVHISHSPRLVSGIHRKLDLLPLAGLSNNDRKRKTENRLHFHFPHIYPRFGKQNSAEDFRFSRCKCFKCLPRINRKMRTFSVFSPRKQKLFGRNKAPHMKKVEIGISYRLHRAFNFHISGECLLRLLHDNNKQPKHRLSISGERQTK